MSTTTDRRPDLQGLLDAARDAYAARVTDPRSRESLGRIFGALGTPSAAEGLAPARLPVCAPPRQPRPTPPASTDPGCGGSSRRSCGSSPVSRGGAGAGRPPTPAPTIPTATPTR